MLLNECNNQSELIIKAGYSYTNIHNAITVEKQQNRFTYDGKRCVISEHQTIKPNVIIIADSTVIVQAIMPKNTSRNKPRNVVSSLLMANRDNLKSQISNRINNTIRIRSFLRTQQSYCFL